MRRSNELTMLSKSTRNDIDAALFESLQGLEKQPGRLHDWMIIGISHQPHKKKSAFTSFGAGGRSIGLSENGMRTKSS